jgi:hypothetical protein
MGRTLNTKLREVTTYDFDTLISKFTKEYYDVADEKCSRLREFSFKLKDEDTLNLTAVYNNLCSTFIGEIQHFIIQRREITIPLLYKKAESNSGLHDCRNCQGDCKLQYTKHVLEIEESHYKLNDLFARLQKVALPLYSADPYPRIYREVRRAMLDIETLIIELLYLEEVFLVPKLMGRHGLDNE